MLLIIYKKLCDNLSGYGLGKFPPIIALKKFIASRVTLNNYILINDSKMYLDSNDSLNLIFRPYETFETEIVKEYIKPGDSVIDAGANIGYFTLLFSRLVGNNGKVYAFEPDPENFKVLSRNIKTNNYNNVVLEQKAISDTSGNINLYTCKDKGDNRIYETKELRTAILVKTTYIDDYFKDRKIDFIKMDIQGAEGKALRGMANVLKSNKDLKIIFEFWPSGILESGDNPLDILELLVNKNFNLYYINTEDKMIQKLKPVQLIEICNNKKEKYINLLVKKL